MVVQEVFLQRGKGRLYLVIRNLRDSHREIDSKVVGQNEEAHGASLERDTTDKQLGGLQGGLCEHLIERVKVVREN